MKVLGCLSAEELLTLTRVNSFFAKVASDQILWKRLCACRQAPHNTINAWHKSSSRVLHEEDLYAHILSLLQMEVHPRCGWQQSQMLVEGGLMQIIQIVWLIPFFHMHA